MSEPEKPAPSWLDRVRTVAAAAWAMPRVRAALIALVIALAARGGWTVAAEDVQGVIKAIESAE